MNKPKHIKQFEKCTEIKRSKNFWRVSCVLGLWSVDAKNKDEAIIEGLRYFLQYKSDGEYSGIIGGKSVLDKII